MLILIFHFKLSLCIQKSLHHESRVSDTHTAERLKGDIKFEQVHFKYATRETPILNVSISRSQRDDYLK